MGFTLAGLRPTPEPSEIVLGLIIGWNWCGRRDLNPHGLRRHPLKMVCLPIPPLPRQGRVHNHHITWLWET